MKFVHTSDLHIGAQLYGYDRLEEQGRMLDRIADLAVENGVDALLVSGDVFDTTQPSNAAQHLLASRLTRLRAAMPGIEIIVTSGNHDSATRHEALAPVWLEAGIRMVGTFRSTDNYDHNIIEIPGKAFVVAVPYVNDRFMSPGAWQGILNAVAERNRSNLPVVMMAHLTVAGASWGGHDTYENYVGGIEIRPLASLGQGYDYLALGHIHTPQKTGPKARYSGSPMAHGFSELYPHSVCLVDIAEHGSEPSVTLLEMPAGIPLKDIPSKGSAVWKDVMKLLAKIPDDMRCYFRLIVEDDGKIPADWRARISNALEGKQAMFCAMETRRKPVEAEAENRKAMTFEGLRTISPAELAWLYLKSRNIDMSGEMTDMFAEIMAEVEQNNREA